MTPKEFIDENYFSLTIDCKREINEIYQALEDYTKTKQLTIPDVVSTFICDTCKDKGSIAYWHKTGMGIKPCKCRKTN